ncbi:3-dehydroshikimate dehydratase [Eutypa lata]|uniref:Putative 3-dehydroshikimate dehydratase protein n=1 Tax=Eutypa lata (strain UCR-EL1) TaxID=1287681 RepID=M7TFB4_EUTLA|nr:putative 3-dehydroshikimate dehydratase protein [Eutypa lata UCREL1]KAI1247702.1 3-dehydroshikimate dehydratase [Eutypa lata]
MRCRLAITSMSLGRIQAGHSLAHRLDMAHKYGYRGIELFYDDLLSIVTELGLGETTSHTNQLLAARVVRDMCAARNISILTLQPFANYEGLVDRAAHAQRLAELQALWFPLAHALGTDIIQIPSSYLPPDQVSGDIDLIARDLREVADLGLGQQPPVRFVYESLGWGTRVDRWEQCWEAVKRVDRPNFGICLDTFNIACAIYADPTSPTGRTPRAEREVRESMQRLVAQVDVRKVFYVQIVDAERLDEPLVEGHRFHAAGLPPRMSWSRNCRLFYGEHDRGAYLPILPMALAIFRGLGFEGWVSLELFNRRMNDTDPVVPEELASRGARSWAKLIRDVGLNTEKEDMVMSVASL